MLRARLKSKAAGWLWMTIFGNKQFAVQFGAWQTNESKKQRKRKKNNKLEQKVVDVVAGGLESTTIAANKTNEQNRHIPPRCRSFCWLTALNMFFAAFLYVWAVSSNDSIVRTNKKSHSQSFSRRAQQTNDILKFGRMNRWTVIYLLALFFIFSVKDLVLREIWSNRTVKGHWAKKWKVNWKVDQVERAFRVRSDDSDKCWKRE